MSGRLRGPAKAALAVLAAGGQLYGTRVWPNGFRFRAVTADGTRTDITESAISELVTAGKIVPLNHPDLGSALIDYQLAPPSDSTPPPEVPAARAVRGRCRMTAPVAVRERPILFSGEMVRATLDGRKTQTRRVVTDATSRGNYRASEMLLNHPDVFADPGPSPAGNPGHYLHAPVNALEVERRRGWKGGDCDDTIVDRLYPWVFAGDLLWVRETFVLESNFNIELPYDPPFTDGRPVKHHPDEGPDGYGAYWEQPHYRATDPTPELMMDGSDEPGCKWTAAIHMPRWASRLTLRITDVHVQRVQEISREDAIAEGVDDFDPRASFRAIWDQLNHKRGHGWDTNPWVWAITFQRVGT